QPRDREEPVWDAFLVQPLAEQLSGGAGRETERQRRLSQAPDHSGHVDALSRRVERGVAISAPLPDFELFDPDRVVQRRVRGDGQDHFRMVPQSRSAAIRSASHSSTLGESARGEGDQQDFLFLSRFSGHFLMWTNSPPQRSEIFLRNTGSGESRGGAPGGASPTQIVWIVTLRKRFTFFSSTRISWGLSMRPTLGRPSV